ncbi:MAG: hypothetical protein V4561_01790 [Bacteroidota bacterium]
MRFCFIIEEIDQEMFEKYRQKFPTERVQLEQELAKGSNRVSNLDKCIETAIQFSMKLASMWTLGGLSNETEATVFAVS